MSNIKRLYYVWDKGENIQITKHFKSNELECKCDFDDCKTQRMSYDLMNRLELTRLELGCPLTVTSAFRCEKYQELLRNTGVNTVVAKIKSQHELGNAVDIANPKKVSREMFLGVCRENFQTIGLADTFLHLDTRGLNSDGRRREWKY